MATDVRLLRVVFEYEDGTTIIYDETDDYAIGSKFFNELSNLGLKSHIMKKSSFRDSIFIRIGKFFKL